MRVLLLTVAFLLNASAAFAQGTHVSGAIAGETWTLGGSPYYVDGDLDVSSLVIEPGVQVRFTGNYGMRVTYLLAAVGTAADSVSFAKEDTVTGWQGILFDNCSSDARLEYCSISGALNSGVKIIDATISVAHCAFRRNSGVSGGGIQASGGAWFRISDCEVADNRAHGGYGGGIFTDCPLSEIVNCTVTGNLLTTGGASLGGGIYADGEALISDCVIGENSISSTTSSLDNRAYGGGVFARGSVTILRCDIRSNSTYSYACCATNPYDYVAATSRGGGIYSYADTRVLNSAVAYNSSTAYSSGYHTSHSTTGGGIFDAGTIQVVGC